MAARREPAANPATENTSFVPIGVFVRGDDGGPALRVETAPSVMVRASPPARSAGGLPDMGPGLIKFGTSVGKIVRPAGSTVVFAVGTDPPHVGYGATNSPTF